MLTKGPSVFNCLPSARFGDFQSCGRLSFGSTEQNHWCRRDDTKPTEKNRDPSDNFSRREEAQKCHVLIHRCTQKKFAPVFIQSFQPSVFRIGSYLTVVFAKTVGQKQPFNSLIYGSCWCSSFTVTEHLLWQSIKIKCWGYHKHSIKTSQGLNNWYNYSASGHDYISLCRIKETIIWYANIYSYIVHSNAYTDIFRHCCTK